MKITQRAKRPRIPAFFAGTILSAAVLGTSVAVASIPSSTTGSITSCVSKRTASVRIIDYQAGKRCHRTERTLSWFSGPTTHRFALPFTAFVGDRTLHKVADLRLPSAGRWVLEGGVTIHQTIVFGSTGIPAPSRYVYVSCELHGVSGKFAGGGDATNDTDLNGNAFENLTVNATTTASASSRTASLWCRADVNAPDNSAVVHSQYVWAQILATRVASFS